MTKKMFAAVLMLLVLACALQAQTWIPTLNGNATFSEFAGGVPNGHITIPNVGIANFPTLYVPGMLTLVRPGLPTTVPQTVGGPDPACGNVYRFPSQKLESPMYTGVKGLYFYGTFYGNGISGFVNNPGQAPALFQEAVFFGENSCYNSGREFGFYYNGADDMIHAYFLTGANMPWQQGNDIAISYVPNQPEGYMLLPYGNAQSCGFQIVASPYVNFYYTVGANITNSDPGFCSAMTGFYESGYVTATALYQPTITQLPLSNGLKLQTIMLLIQ